MIDPTVLTAAIPSAASVTVAVTVLVLSHRRSQRLERRMAVIEADLRNFRQEQLALVDQR